ncbi:MAG: DNA polymerase [Oscillospiraceae bacterium]|nr:DNA polymerase [Oscillospiraceae bacterium]
MKILLIDGNSLINRSFYAIRLLSNKKGVYTNAITGFFNVLLKLRGEISPNFIAVAFDLRAPTFRHEMYDGYKKRRKGMPEELAVQMPYIKEILDCMGVARVELAGYEADDIIGTLSKIAGSPQNPDLSCVIATGDRDSFQLINEKVAVRLASTKGEDVVYTPAKIEEVYGIRPLQFIEVKALMGDSSDDIPGVAGIGEKTAFSLIHKYLSVEKLYENPQSLDVTAGVKTKLEQGREMCFLSRKLAEIAVDIPVDTSLETYKITSGNPEKLSEILTELEIFSLLKKLQMSPAAIKSNDTGENDNSKKQSSRLPENSPKVAELEVKLEQVLRDMERAGFKINKDGLAKFGEELIPQITRIESQIHELAGEEFNVASPKQLSSILFDKLGLPSGSKTKTKEYSTKSEVLDFLFDKHDIVPLIIEFRALSKLNSTYVKGLLEHVDSDGRIRTTFKNETATGRISSTEPNIQNIPVRTERGRILRRFFVADKGNLLIDADYSQIELRVLAHISADPVMLGAFRDGADIHTITASQVFGVSEKSVSREMRSAAKAVNFGIVYGMGAFSLSKEIGVSVALAKDYIERYLGKYEGVREYLNSTVEQAKSNGYVTTLLGRVRAVPEIRSENKNIVAAGERIAKNTPIQGTAADIIKIAMVRVNDRLRETDSKLILQVHDELIAESPKSAAHETANILKSEMVAAGRDLSADLDLSVEVEVGESWYETH